MNSQPDSEARNLPTLGTLLVRAARLRCPSCGGAKIFRNWLAMHDRCDACGRKFDRAPGYLLGSIYFNYGITALLVIVFYFSMFLTEAMTGKQLLMVLTLFILLFPVWFFRYARSLWLAFDEKFDPWPNDQEAREMAENDQAAQT